MENGRSRYSKYTASTIQHSSSGWILNYFLGCDPGWLEAGRQRDGGARRQARADRTALPKGGDSAQCSVGQGWKKMKKGRKAARDW